MTKRMWAVVNSEGHGGIWPSKEDAARWQKSDADGVSKSDRLMRVVEAKKPVNYGRQDIGVKLMMLKNQLARMGLWKSVHALDEAAFIYGWEAADKYTKEDKKK